MHSLGSPSSCKWEAVVRKLIAVLLVGVHCATVAGSCLKMMQFAFAGVLKEVTMQRPTHGGQACGGTWLYVM